MHRRRSSLGYAQNEEQPPASSRYYIDASQMWREEMRPATHPNPSHPTSP
ncbi:hypothetical protein E2C01_085376 [Portunus trituberculatus]|uniref:Uncharacterized protein n=1 Tax=Portunus trituberculatus TaxID=210409 RepID=A0A5B7J2I2_PORTR|nr:hypothetical protein [Portunus trituberculatus]